MKSSVRIGIASAVCAFLGLVAMVMSWFGLYPRPHHFIFFGFWALFLCTSCVLKELERR